MPKILPLEGYEAVTMKRSQRSEHRCKWKVSFARVHIMKGALGVLLHVLQMHMTNARRHLRRDMWRFSTLLQCIGWGPGDAPVRTGHLCENFVHLRHSREISVGLQPHLHTARLQRLRE